MNLQACARSVASPIALRLQRQQPWQQRQHRQQRQPRPQPPASSYKSNPQNVDQCQAPPAPEHSGEEAVRIQLAALQRNDEPWGNHGVQTAYEWALDVGGLDPSMYFGYPKDLYHQDHFQGMFANRLPELINNQGFEVVSCEERDGGDGSAPTTVVVAEVASAQGSTHRFEFQLRRKAVGARKGSLMTWMLRKLAEPQ